jgi:hypothetical protein
MPKAFCKKQKDKKSTLLEIHPSRADSLRIFAFPGKWSSKTPQAHVYKKKDMPKAFQNK